MVSRECQITLELGLATQFDVADASAVNLSGDVLFTEDISGLLARDRSTGSASIFPTSLQVAYASTIELGSNVLFAFNNRRLTAVDISTRATQILATALNIANPSAVALISEVTLTSNERTLTAGYCGHSISMSGQR